MKIYKKEISHDYAHSSKTKHRVLFAINKDELEMFVGILSKAYKSFPDTLRYLQESNRIQQMVKVGHRALRDWDIMEIEK